jgi:multicomponent K+:H+ antiporter subunit E
MQNTVAPGQILLGMLLALILPWLTHRFWPEHTRWRRPLGLIPYVGIVLYDIVVANLIVARIILSRPREVRSRFIHLPLELRGEFAITLLANTITLTPGTVSAGVDRDHHRLLIHCLDVADEALQIAQIKQRYERRLLEIFE